MISKQECSLASDLNCFYFVRLNVRQLYFIFIKNNSFNKNANNSLFEMLFYCVFYNHLCSFPQDLAVSNIQKKAM